MKIKIFLNFTYNLYINYQKYNDYIKYNEWSIKHESITDKILNLNNENILFEQHLNYYINIKPRLDNYFELKKIMKIY